MSTPLKRVDVYVTNQLVNGDDQYCGSINVSTTVSHRNRIGYTVCNTPLDGRYLKIRNSDGSGIRICELEIFGKQHLFGRYIISYIAFYFKRVQCFIYRHELETGGLRKDLELPDCVGRTYGVRCKDCNCMNNTVCNRATGHCSFGCAAGYCCTDCSRSEYLLYRFVLSPFSMFATLRCVPLPYRYLRLILRYSSTDSKTY